MWVGLIHSAKSLLEKNRDFCEEGESLTLARSVSSCLFPALPHSLQACQAHSRVSQFLKINLLCIWNLQLVLAPMIQDETFL